MSDVRPSISRLLLPALLVLLAPAVAFASPPELNVRDFGAIPNDAQDDAPAIRSAIAQAVARHIPVVRFEAGRYDLQTNQEGNLEGTNGAWFLRVSVPPGRPRPRRREATHVVVQQNDLSDLPPETAITVASETTDRIELHENKLRPCRARKLHFVQCSKC